MTLILRGKSTRFYAYLLYFLAGASLVASAVNGGVGELVWSVPISLFIATTGWAVFWNPRIEVGPGGVRVVNIFREHLIPWADLALTENRWGLYLYTKAADRKVGVWAVPSNAGLFHNSWRDRNKEYEDPDITWHDSGTQTRTVQSGFAADLIRIRHKAIAANARLRASLRTQMSEYWPEETVTTITLLPIIALLATFAGAALTVYTGR